MLQLSPLITILVVAKRVGLALLAFSLSQCGVQRTYALDSGVSCSPLLRLEGRTDCMIVLYPDMSRDGIVLSPSISLRLDRDSRLCDSTGYFVGKITIPQAKRFRVRLHRRIWLRLCIQRWH